MSVLQPVRGTHDLLPEEMRKHRVVTETGRDIAERYGYLEMATPIFEFTDVFKRTLGDTSDIVTKEMYTFAIGDGDQITLRPENTASVVRAVMSNGLTQQLPLKYYYSGPMFRHERPQKGRQRQFHQIGVELFGVSDPAGDVEIIACGAHILDELGILSRTRLELNTLGTPDCRKAYRTALVAYFQDHKDRLSEDSRDRLDRNPLRILDSKNKGDQALVAEAPVFSDFLSPDSHDFFAAVKEGLDRLGIIYELNPRLVRGLDYYCHTAFEFKTDELGAQDTVMGGGRYDYLMEMMGGPSLPGVGWAAGVERIALMAVKEPEVHRPIAIVPVGADASDAADRLAAELRREGFAIDVAFSGNMKKRMRRADRVNATAAVLLGDDELAQESATVRNLESGEQELVPLKSLKEKLASFR